VMVIFFGMHDPVWTEVKFIVMPVHPKVSILQKEKIAVAIPR
jgi:hypothetical protein